MLFSAVSVCYGPYCDIDLAGIFASPAVAHIFAHLQYSNPQKSALYPPTTELQQVNYPHSVYASACCVSFHSHAPSGCYGPYCYIDPAGIFASPAAARSSEHCKLAGLPDLNHSSPSVLSRMQHVFNHTLAMYTPDGLRLDAAGHSHAVRLLLLFCIPCFKPYRSQLGSMTQAPHHSGACVDTCICNSQDTVVSTLCAAQKSCSSCRAMRCAWWCFSSCFPLP
jgi:hypothetical protein